MGSRYGDTEPPPKLWKKSLTKYHYDLRHHPSRSSVLSTHRYYRVRSNLLAGMTITSYINRSFRVDHRHLTRIFPGLWHEEIGKVVDWCKRVDAVERAMKSYGTD